MASTKKPAPKKVAAPRPATPTPPVLGPDVAPAAADITVTRTIGGNVFSVNASSESHGARLINAHAQGLGLTAED